jgi:hypothetical protein
MHTVERFERDPISGRHLFLLELPTAVDLPANLSFPTSRFACLLVWGAKAATVDDISSVARWLLDAGAVYICAWGPDCERVHDIIDEEIVGPNPDAAAVPAIMTTWHANESLTDAIEFCLACAQPDDAYVDECGSILAISIGSPQWGSEIRSTFSRPA